MPGMQRIEGLASSLNITEIVDALMEFERRPVTLMEQEKEFKTQQVAAYQAVLAKFIALQSNAALLKKESFFNKASITNSDESVLTATGTGRVTSGAYNVRVLSLARNHQMASAGVDNIEDTIFGTGEIKLKVGDAGYTIIEIETGNNSLVGIKDAINNADLGVSASIINDGSSSNPYRLLLSADRTGALNRISYEIDLTGGEALDFDAATFDNPETISAAGTTTSTISLGATANYSGAENKIYTFTVEGEGVQTVGSGPITISWTDGVESGSIQIDEADTEYEVLKEGGLQYEGLKLSFAAGDLTAGDTFQVGTFAPLLQEASDARISIGGDGSGSPIIVTSDTNSFNETIPGLNLQVKKISAPGEYVTLRTDIDANAVKAGVQTFIDKYNDVMDFIDEQFSYNQDTTESGVLFTEYPLQVMQSSLRLAATSVVASLESSLNSLAAVGIRSDSDGRLRIADSSALLDAINNDLDNFIKLFVDSGTSSSLFIEFVAASSETVVGQDYAVDITQVATKGYFEGEAITDPSETPLVIDSSNNTIIMKADGLTSGQITLSERTYSSGEDLAAEIQARITAEDKIGNRGLIVEWVDEGATGHLKVTSGSYGSNSTIVMVSTSETEGALASLGLENGTYTDGLDVAGTINGESATGKGQVLTGDEGNANTAGLKLKITLAETGLGDGAEGTVSVVRGLASIIDKALESTTKSIDGSIARRTSALNNQIEFYEGRIEDYNERLELRRERLYAEFLAMEEALSRYQSEGSYLEAQLENLNSNFKMMIGGDRG